MLKSIIWYTDLFFSLVIKVIDKSHVKKMISQGTSQESEYYIYRKVSEWAKRRLQKTGSVINVYGLENLPETNVLFISNHQSNFDIPLLLGHIDKPKGFIAKKELSKLPFITEWMKLINCLFMDRDDLKQSMQVIIDGINLLKSGHSMVIFPEGTRSKGGPLGEFKAGSFKLATKSKVPIVPITIDGTYKIMEQNNNKIKAASVNLYIHPPIDTTKLTKEEITSLPETVKSIIQSKLPN